MRNIGLYTSSYILWIALLVYLSLKPDLNGPSIEIPYFDKLAHAGFYFVASFLFLTSVEHLNKHRLRRSIVVSLTLILHLILGGLIELIQHNYVTGRSGELEDFIANFIGLILSVLVFYSKWNYFYRSN